MLASCLAVGAGGFLGAISRYLVSLIPVPSGDFPLLTLGINVLGALVLGALTGLAQRTALPPQLLLFLRVGLCGGFTTFSTFSVETFQLFQSGRTGLALLYALGSLVLGVAAVWLGAKLAG